MKTTFFFCDKMLLPASILSLGFLCMVIGNPSSQLRLSHSGYEIISFNNEQTPDDAVSSIGTKNSTRNYNDIGLLNLEKVNDPLDEIDEISTNNPQQSKRNYESTRLNAGTKKTTEIRHNMIELPFKETVDLSSRRNSVYLSLGIPRRFHVNSENQRKDSSNDQSVSDKTESSVKSKLFQEHWNHHDDHGNQEKIIESMINSRIKEKKQNHAVKTKSKQPKQLKQLKNLSIDTGKVRNQVNEKPIKIHESEIESLLNLNKIKALVLDSSRDLDFYVDGSDSEEKNDKTEIQSGKSVFPLIAKLPNIRINNNPRNFWLPTKIPAMYSPIYPAGFDIMTSDSRHLSRNLRFDSKQHDGRINDDVDSGERRKIIGGHEMTDVGGMGTKNFVKSWNLDRTNQRIPSFTIIKSTLNGINDHTSNIIPSVNAMSVNLADFLPFTTGTRLNILPMMNLKNQRTTERNKEQNHPNVDLTMLHRHSEESGPMLDVRKIRSRDDDLDSRYLDSKILAVNNRISKTGTNADVHKSPVERSNNTDSQPSLIVDILHEITGDDYESTYADVNKDETDMFTKEFRDFRRAQTTNVIRNKCKRMKNFVTPMFYQFLGKFTESVMENALQYEMSLRIRENTSKLFDDSGRRKIIDDEMINQLT